MAVNDDVYTYLARLGYEGAFNDKLYKHLTAEGFLQQSLADKLAAAGGYKSYVLGSLLSDSIVGSLFYANEQGVWYDPNDLTTLFQDSAGTTPVTAAGQPVGLMLDKSKGLILGPELYTGGDITAVPIGGPSFTNYSLGVSKVVGKTYIITFTVQNYSGTGSVAVAGNAPVDFHTFPAGLSGNGTITNILIAANTAMLALYSRSTNTCTFTNISVRELPGNHAFQSTAASRPILRRNATTSAYYLETDGVDDWMQTNAIDFTGTDKVSLFTGVRKLSDAAAGIVVELSPGGNANTFAIFAPPTAANTFGFASRGTISANANASGFAAPISAVLAGIGNISGDVSNLRVNGAQAANITTDQGLGSYSNQPLYLLRRGGTSLPFNGHFYGLTIVGRLASASEITNVERIYANKTGVTLA